MSKAAIRNKTLIETLSEEMRILYVALTRAKEKLIVTGIKKDYEKEREKILLQIERYQKQGQKINPILLKKYIKYIDWILLVYFYERKEIESFAELRNYTTKQILDFCKAPETQDVDIIQIMNKQAHYDYDKSEIEKISNILNTKYTYELSTKIPTKSSVTKIKQGANQEKVEISFPVPKFLGKEENIKLTGAQKGTLLHLCMQKLDESKDYDLDAVKKLINNLVELEIITQKEAENINPMSVLKFTQSRIWESMKHAKEVQREKPFYMTIPAKDVYQEEVLEDILVQGMIDLYYINKDDELILVDYKTDFVQTEEELIHKYKKQLELYKKALEEALNRQVNHMFIYSTFLGKELEVLK